MTQKVQILMYVLSTASINSGVVDIKRSKVKVMKPYISQAQMYHN